MNDVKIIKSDFNVNMMKGEVPSFGAEDYVGRIGLLVKRLEQERFDFAII